MSQQTNQQLVDFTDVETETVNTFRVIKRNGSLEEVNRQKIHECIIRNSSGLHGIDQEFLLNRVHNGLHNKIHTSTLYDLLINISAMNITYEPEYSKLAARLLNRKIVDELKRLEITNFSDSIRYGFDVGIINRETAFFVEENNGIRHL